MSVKLPGHACRSSLIVPTRTFLHFQLCVFFRFPASVLRKIVGFAHCERPSTRSAHVQHTCDTFSDLFIFCPRSGNTTIECKFIYFFLVLFRGRSPPPRTRPSQREGGGASAPPAVMAWSVGGGLRPLSRTEKCLELLNLPPPLESYHASPSRCLGSGSRSN